VFGDQAGQFGDIFGVGIVTQQMVREIFGVDDQPFFVILIGTAVENFLDILVQVEEILIGIDPKRNGFSRVVASQASNLNDG